MAPLAPPALCPTLQSLQLLRDLQAAQALADTLGFPLVGLHLEQAIVALGEAQPGPCNPSAAAT